jgi:phosphate transport system permease protein
MDPGQARTVADVDAARTQAAEQRSLRRRYRRDTRFKFYTIVAIAIAGGFLLIFVGDLLRRGTPALRQAEVLVPITYSPDTIEVPRLAFPEEYRDVVSYTRMRQIPREGERIEIRVRVGVNDESRADPRAGVGAMTIGKDEFFGAWKDKAPFDLTPREVRRAIHDAGWNQIADAIASADADGDIDVWVWASDPLDHFLKYGGKARSHVQEIAELLEQAGRTQRVFDVLTFGEVGGTVEEWVLATSDVDQYLKGYAYMQPESYELPEMAPLSPQLIDQINTLHDQGKIRLAFNSYFFLNGDSKLAEAAGLRSAIIGSVLVLTIVFLLCMPIGVLTAIYLEEFAPDNLLTQIIEVNINNLAAIPSILFGLLGLGVLINYAEMPRSSALVGGATLALRTLPIIIISSRASLRAVPDSIRMAAHSVGASRWQVVLHHILPLSMSGILTGSIIGIAQAMGETAPLIIVGLVAFVPDAPDGPLDATTVLPAQIYSWWEMPERAFQERAALAILVLLVILFAVNGLAVILRARAERRW